MKFLKTIRFDLSDDHVFPKAAGPDEWALPGGFAFSNVNEQELTGKRKQAFANGFLSLDSFRRSTFVSVAMIEHQVVDQLTARLCRHFTDCYGAPSYDAAYPVAQSEIDFTLDLCRDAPVNTVFSLVRYIDDTGEIREEFHMVDRRSEHPHTRIWDVVKE